MDTELRCAAGDGRAGGGLRAGSGDLAGLPFLAAVVNRMVREDQRDAALFEDVDGTGDDQGDGGSHSGGASCGVCIWTN